jgi:hypothetical protein
MKKTNAVILMCASLLYAPSCYSQTQVDIRTQGRNFDLSSANTTKPLKAGTALPAQCSTGEMFFKTDAAAGQNVYGCVAMNSWQVQSGSGGMPAGPSTARPSVCSDGALYYNVDLSSVTGCHPNNTWNTVATGSAGSLLPLVTGVFPGSTATLGAACLTQMCGAAFGSTNCTFSNAPTFQINAGGAATTGRVWVNSSCQRIVNYDSSLTMILGNGLVADTASTAFPVDVMPLATFTTSGSIFTSVTNIPYPKAITLSSGAGPWIVTNTATGFQGACPTCADTSAPNIFAGKQTMTPTTAVAGLNLGALAGDPASCASGDVWYNSNTNKFRSCVAGVAQDLNSPVSPARTTAWPFGWPGNSGGVRLGGPSGIVYYQFFSLGAVGGTFNRAIFHTAGSDSGKFLTACIMDATGALVKQSSVVNLGTGSGKAAVAFAGGVTIKDGYWLGLLSDSTVVTVYSSFADGATDSMWNDYLTGESASTLPIASGSNPATGSGSSLGCPSAIGTRVQVAPADAHYPTVGLLQ